MLTDSLLVDSKFEEKSLHEKKRSWPVGEMLQRSATGEEAGGGQDNCTLGNRRNEEKEVIESKERNWYL